MASADAPREHPPSDQRRTSVVTGTVGVSRLGPRVLERAGLRRVDYADHFTLTPLDGRSVSPERWARAMFGDVPDATERFIWQGLLQFRLASGHSPATIAGWSITGQGDDWVRLQTASWLLTGNLIIQATSDTLSLTTLLHYDRPLGAVQWRPLSAIHRRMVPGVLRRTAAKVTTSNGRCL